MNQPEPEGQPELDVLSASTQDGAAKMSPPDPATESPSVPPIDPRTYLPPPLQEPPTTPTFEATQPVAEPEPEVVPEPKTRMIVTQPKIGDGSAFSKADWWKTDWWLLDGRGLSNDIVCDIGRVADIFVAAASQRGNKHRITATACQDAFYTRSTACESGPNFMVAAIGDGLSSAEHASYSSRRATQLVVDQIVRKLEQVTAFPTSAEVESIIDTAITTAAREILDWRPIDFGTPTTSAFTDQPNSLGTTLTIAVLPASIEGESRPFTVATIGDSPTFLLREGRWQRPTPHEEPTELVTTKTDAFPATASTNIIHSRINNGEALLLTTDGLGNFIENGGQPLALGTFLAEQWIQPVDMISFVNHVNVDLATADDDRAAIMIWVSPSVEQ